MDNAIVKKNEGSYKLYYVNAHIEDTPYLIDKCFISIKT